MASDRRTPSLQEIHRRGIPGYASGRFSPIFTAESEWGVVEIRREVHKTAWDFVCEHARDPDLPETVRLSTQNARMVSRFGDDSWHYSSQEGQS